ncbi:unnamed protein product, partial [Rotaria sp. Silwood2]
TSEIELILQNSPTIIEAHQLQSIIAQFFLSNLRNRIVSQTTVPISPQNSIVGPQTNNPRELVHDLLRRITETCNRVVHGEGENNAILNKQTINDIYIYKFDSKMAEQEVIERILGTNKHDELTFEQKQKYNLEIKDVVTKRIHQRYFNELKRLSKNN